jgi:hypothetical protein
MARVGRTVAPLRSRQGLRFVAVTHLCELHRRRIFALRVIVLSTFLSGTSSPSTGYRGTRYALASMTALSFDCALIPWDMRAFTCTSVGDRSSFPRLGAIGVLTSDQLLFGAQFETLNDSNGLSAGSEVSPPRHHAYGRTALQPCKMLLRLENNAIRPARPGRSAVREPRAQGEVDRAAAQHQPCEQRRAQGQWRESGRAHRG